MKFDFKYWAILSLLAVMTAWYLALIVEIVIAQHGLLGDHTGWLIFYGFFVVLFVCQAIQILNRYPRKRAEDEPEDE